jgi:hypothetical protein
MWRERPGEFAKLYAAVMPREFAKLYAAVMPREFAGPIR